jgi:hypothetical protein
LGRFGDNPNITHVFFDKPAEAKVEFLEYNSFANCPKLVYFEFVDSIHTIAL